MACQRLGTAPKTIDRFVERVNQLYEQDAEASRIGEYTQPWWLWVGAGVSLKGVWAGWSYLRAMVYRSVLPVPGTEP